jgi:hypothetical protein
MAPSLDIARFVNPAVADSVEEIAERFRTARPFSHVVIDEFLTASFCRSVCDAFPAFGAGASLNEDGNPGGKSTQDKVRELGPSFEQMDDLVKSPEFLGLVEQITGIRKLRYDPWYFGGGTHENLAGQDLDPHVDFNYHPITRQHRRLNLIVYLNEEWRDSWGGSLQLHRDPYLEPDRDEIVTVTPLMNRCVIFETSERSWHGFQPIQLPDDRPDFSRKSFAVYFYTDSRPAEETANEHSTVYVERHLPDRFVPGRVLDQADVDELKGLLARRDQHLQRLYRKIQEANGKLNESWFFSAEMQLRRHVYELEHSLSWRITAPLRALKRALRRLAGRHNGPSQQDG